MEMELDVANQSLTMNHHLMQTRHKSRSCNAVDEVAAGDDQPSDHSSLHDEHEVDAHQLRAPTAEGDNLPEEIAILVENAMDSISSAAQSAIDSLTSKLVDLSLKLERFEDVNQAQAQNRK